MTKEEYLVSVVQKRNKIIQLFEQYFAVNQAHLSKGIEQLLTIVKDSEKEIQSIVLYASYFWYLPSLEYFMYAEPRPTIDSYCHTGNVNCGGASNNLGGIYEEFLKFIEKDADNIMFSNLEEYDMRDGTDILYLNENVVEIRQKTDSTIINMYVEWIKIAWENIDSEIYRNEIFVEFLPSEPIVYDIRNGKQVSFKWFE